MGFRTGRSGEKYGDVIRPHAHGLEELPYGSGPGKLQLAPVFVFQPPATTGSPGIGPGPILPVVIPEMTTGPFTLPPLPEHARQYVAKCQFSMTALRGGVQGTIGPVSAFLVVDGVPDFTTQRLVGDIAAADTAGPIAIPLAFQKRIVLTPGVVHTIEVFWAILLGASTVFVNPGLERILTVEVVPE